MVFKKLIAALWIGMLLFTSHAFSQEKTVQKINTNPALWVIENQGHKTYFLGSIHLLPKDVVWYGSKIKSAFEAADEVIFEIDMSDPQMEKKAQAIMMKYVMLPEGQSLKSVLDEETYKRSMLVAKNLLGAPEAGVSAFQPWFLSLQFTVVSVMKMGFNPNEGIDKKIAAFAKLKNVKVSALETIEDQMSAIGGQKMSVQLEMLKDTLHQLDDFSKYMKDLLDAWKSGDEKELATALVDYMKKSPELYEALLVKRNKAWVSVLEKLMAAKQNNFVVVGAAHLVGSDSVLNMLKAKGYKVSRVQ